MDNFEKDRNEAFASMDEKKIKEYCNKYNINIPKDENIFWMAVHKVICYLYLNENSHITLEQYNKSYEWLIRNGATPTISDLSEERNVKLELAKKSKKCLSNGEKLDLMLEYMSETGKEITTKTKYKGYNIGYLRNNLRQMYYNGTLNIDNDLLDKFIKAGIIKAEKERIRTSQQKKYEFLMSLAGKSENIREKAKMKNGMTYNDVRKQLQIEYNRNNIKLTDEQIDNLRKQNILNYSKEEIKKIEDNYKMPSKYVIDIITNYGSLEAFEVAYKKCQCDYNFNNEIFCGFRGITVSEKDISEYQKLQYAILIKDLLSIDISKFEYNTGKYLDIDELEEKIRTIPERRQKFIRYYYGLDGKKYTYNEISNVYGISSERVRQILKDAKKMLAHPYRSKNIIRDYQKDIVEIEDNNTKINNLKSEIGELQIIIEYFSSTDYNYKNIGLSELKVDTNKLEKLKEENIENIQDLIKKWFNKIDKIPLETLNFSTGTFEKLRRAGIYTLNDLINSTSHEILRIRNLGANKYNEIINKLSSIGLRLRKENEGTNKIEYWDMVIYKSASIKKFFKYDQKIKLENLNDISNKNNQLKSKIYRYYKAVEQYLNKEDIFNSEYNVLAINLDKENYENFDNLKILLNDLKISNSNNVVENDDDDEKLIKEIQKKLANNKEEIKDIKWKLENRKEVLENIDINIIENELNKVDTLEYEYLILIPSKSIKNTDFLQVYNEEDNESNKNEKEKFHIEICFKDNEEEFTIIGKDNLTKAQVLKIFIEYFENNNLPEIKNWYIVGVYNTH